MLICSVVGARPNFMKIAPVFLELKRRKIPQLLVHTGQHYDANMSQVFFEELGLPVPDIYLGVGSDSHARQTARIMVLFEEVVRKHRPDLVIVGGDVNSTLATALVAAKEHIPVAHVKRVFAPSIEPCPRKSTGWSLTISPICSLRQKEVATRIFGKRGYHPRGFTLWATAWWTHC